MIIKCKLNLVPGWHGRRINTRMYSKAAIIKKRLEVKEDNAPHY